MTQPQKEKQAREALEAAEEYLSSNCPANSYGLLDHAEDRKRSAALALVRAALAAPPEPAQPESI